MRRYRSSWWTFPALSFMVSARPRGFCCNPFGFYSFMFWGYQSSRGPIAFHRKMQILESDGNLHKGPFIPSLDPCSYGAVMCCRTIISQSLYHLQNCGWTKAWTHESKRTQPLPRSHLRPLRWLSWYPPQHFQEPTAGSTLQNCYENRSSEASTFGKCFLR